MNRFGIHEDFLTGVTVRYSYTDEAGYDCTTTSNVDHPAFAGLREHLGARNIIHIERSWINGDRVLEDFVLNDKVFKKGEKFVCAGAMKLHLKYME